MDSRSKRRKQEQHRPKLSHHLRLSREAILYLWMVAAHIRRCQGVFIKEQARQHVPLFYTPRKEAYHGFHTMPYRVCRCLRNENLKITILPNNAEMLL